MKAFWSPQPIKGFWFHERKEEEKRQWEGGKESTSDGDRYQNLIHCFYCLPQSLKTSLLNCAQPSLGSESWTLLPLEMSASVHHGVFQQEPAGTCHSSLTHLNSHLSHVDCFNHSLFKYLLSTYYMLYTFWEYSSKQDGKNFYLHVFKLLTWETKK